MLESLTTMCILSKAVPIPDGNKYTSTSLGMINLLHALTVEQKSSVHLRG